MVKANELRIGNYLNWNADHGCAGTLRVEAIQEFSYLAVGLAKCQPTSEVEYEYEVERIGITREWLEKLGFEFRGFLKVNDYESETQFTLRQNEENYTCSVVTSNYGGFIECHWRFRVDGDILYMRTKLEFVHQLQNLFYLLTGEELTIKEPV